MSHTKQLIPQNRGWNIEFRRGFGVVLQKVVQWVWIQMEGSFQVRSG